MPIRPYGKLDIIIPVYNKEKYLEKCVNSALSQSYAPDTVILADDGSTDGSAALCDKLASGNEKIKVIHKENGGAASARNAGLAVSEGDYVGFIDADDWVDADMYEKLITGIESDPELKVAEVKGGGNGLKPSGKEPAVLSPEDYFCELMMHTGDASMCTKVFKGDFIRKFRFREGEYNEDFELLLRMLPELDKGILDLDTPGYNIELSEDSVTRSAYRQKFYSDMMQNAFIALRVSREKFPFQIERAERFVYVQALDFMLHIPVEEMNKKNAFYMRILRYLRSEEQKIMKNRYLSAKDRKYLILLLETPVAARKTHRFVMRARGKSNA